MHSGMLVFVRLTYRFVAIAVNLPAGNARYRGLNAALGQLGHALDRHGGFSLTLAEDDPDLPRWLEFSATRDDVTVQHGTTFDEAELDSADHLEFAVDWHNGYPQPESSFGYLRETFDLTDYCEACGIGKVQNAPYRLRGEPRWGTRHLMGINWDFDAVFCRSEVASAVFDPLGIDTWSVLDHRTGQPLESVVQLRLAPTDRAHLDVTFDEAETCASCRRVKYSPQRLGYFAPLLGTETKPMFRTREWFGSGGEARQPVVVSQVARRAMLAASLKPLYFAPLARPPASARPSPMTPSQRSRRSWRRQQG